MTEETKPVVRKKVLEDVAATRKKPAAVPVPEQKVYPINVLLAAQKQYHDIQKQKAQKEAEYIAKAVAKMKEEDGLA